MEPRYLLGSLSAPVPVRNALIATQKETGMYALINTKENNMLTRKQASNLYKLLGTRVKAKLFGVVPVSGTLRSLTKTQPAKGPAIRTARVGIFQVPAETITIGE